MKKKVWKLLGLILLVLGVFVACREESFILDDSEGMVKEEMWGDGDVTGESTEDAIQEMIYVHICGAVVSPGVYALPSGSRVYDGLDLAGGFDEEADRETVNLVEELSDGQQVRIPFIGETDAQEGSGLIDINQADVSLLCEIPGIGESRAQAILDYREEHGGFQTVEELMQVPGIKEGLYAKIFPYVECRN